MIKRTVDQERSFGVDEAIAKIRSLEENLNISFITEIVKESNTGNIITTKSKIIDRKSSEILSEASGKGIGKQAEASGLYEALEHAAFKYKLPGSETKYKKVNLGNKEIAKIDYAYKYSMNCGEKIDAIRFNVLNEDYTLNDRYIYYPAILSDVHYPVYKSTASLIPLSYYSTNTGIASGANLKDAIMHAVNELIERDAESKFLLDIFKKEHSFQLINLTEGDHLYDEFIELTGGYQGKGAIYCLDSICGYAFCVQSETIDGKEELGLGASMNPIVALERAMTELQQLQYAKSIGNTWKDEGGGDISKLDKYPNMKKIAKRIFSRPQTDLVEMKTIISNFSGNTNPIEGVKRAGFQPFARVIWNDQNTEITVAQVIIPGFETLNNLIFCRPMLPVGHLRKRENIDFLLSN